MESEFETSTVYVLITPDPTTGRAIHSLNDGTYSYEFKIGDGHELNLGKDYSTYNPNGVAIQFQVPTQLRKYLKNNGIASPGTARGPGRMIENAVFGHVANRNTEWYTMSPAHGNDINWLKDELINLLDAFAGQEVGSRAELLFLRMQNRNRPITNALMADYHANPSVGSLVLDFLQPIVQGCNVVASSGVHVQE
ncbi:hypothetical protein FRC08_010613 [Ceratobasidium sp. 394]|nr:hypothetical protein FRC08_010613 [Ceratobasidium sp. 394]